MLLLRASLFLASCLGAAISAGNGCTSGNCDGSNDVQRVDYRQSYLPVEMSGELKRRSPRKCHKPYTTTTTSSSSAPSSTTTGDGVSTTYGTTTASTTTSTELPISTTTDTTATTTTTESTTTTADTTTTTESTTATGTTTTTTDATTTTSESTVTTSDTTTTTSETTTTTESPTTTTMTTTTTTTTTTTSTCFSGIETAAYTATTAAFINSGIVPTLIPSLDPLLEVNIDYNGKAVEIGTPFSTLETLNQPDLTFTNEADTTLNPDTTTYSYFLMDPDVPNPDAGVLRQTFLHWYVSGAKGSCAESAATNSQTVVIYQAPTPLSTQEHRYTFLVYREPAGYVPDTITPQVRIGFDINAYAAQSGLTLVGGNYFLEGILTGTVPP